MFAVVVMVVVVAVVVGVIARDNMNLVLDAHKLLGMYMLQTMNICVVLYISSCSISIRM